MIAVLEANTVELPEDLSRKVGTIGGHSLVLGSSDPIDVEKLIETFEGAIPRLMAG